MLESLEGVRVNEVPKTRRVAYRDWCCKLGDADIAKAKQGLHDHLDSLFEKCDHPTVEVSWIVGGDGGWEGTPFEGVYYAAGQSELQAGFFIGLLLWDVLIERYETWVFLKDDEGRECMKYFVRTRD